VVVSKPEKEPTLGKPKLPLERPSAGAVMNFTALALHRLILILAPSAMSSRVGQAALEAFP